MRLVHPASTSFCFSYMLFKFRKFRKLKEFISGVKGVKEFISGVKGVKEFILGVKGVKELSLPMVAEELRQ